MESHPLNLAHQQHRRAEAHLKYNRYDEAMQCHHNAAELLLDAMKSTTSSVALESMTLQHSYHLKQKDFIKNKKEQYARVKKALDNIKLLSEEQELNLHGNDILKLQVGLFKALNEAESLLDILLANNEIKENEIVETNKDDVDGTNTVQTQEAVFEKLKIKRQNLYSMTEQIVLQIELVKDENTILKEKINYLEKERVKFLNIQSQDVSIDRNEFSALSMTEGFSKEPSQTESTSSSNKPFNVLPFEEANHFDLSALHDNLE